MADAFPSFLTQASPARSFPNWKSLASRDDSGSLVAWSVLPLSDVLVAIDALKATLRAAGKDPDACLEVDGAGMFATTPSPGFAASARPSYAAVRAELVASGRSETALALLTAEVLALQRLAKQASMQAGLAFDFSLQLYEVLPTFPPSPVAPPPFHELLFSSAVPEGLAKVRAWPTGMPPAQMYDAIKHGIHLPLTQDAPAVAELARRWKAGEYAPGKSMRAGPIDPIEGMTLYQLIVDNGFKTVVEVGCASGTSSLYMLQGLSEVAAVAEGSGSAAASLTAIDPSQASFWGNIGSDAVASTGLGHLFQLVSKPSALALPQLLDDASRGPESVDLVFIDGCHRFDDVLLDITYAAKLLRVGGVLVLDDAHPALPGVLRAANFARTNLARVFAYVPDAPPSASTAVFVKTCGMQEDAGLGYLREPSPGVDRHWNHWTPF